MIKRLLIGMAFAAFSSPASAQNLVAESGSSISAEFLAFRISPL